MLISKEGYQSGVKDVDGSYKIYNNTTIRKDQIELKNEDVTTNEVEASINCTNNGCTGFIKQLKDGETRYYDILDKPYTENNNYNLTPEERDDIKPNQSSTTAKDHAEDYHKKTKAVFKESLQNKNDNGLSKSDLKFIFMIMGIIILLTIFMKNRVIYKSPFSKCMTVKYNYPYRNINDIENYQFTPKLAGGDE